MPKVTMSLTDRDVTNTEKLRTELRARSNAHVISIALSLTAFIVDELKKNYDLVLRSPDGNLERIRMPELEAVKDERRTVA